MLKNFFVIALRTIGRNRLTSIINITGLSTGIACTFLIIIFIIDDLSFDRSYKNNENIYRVALERIYPENKISYAIIPYSIGEAIETDFPEIQSCVRLFKIVGEFVIEYEEKKFVEKNICFADSNFFDMFSIPIIEGDPSKVLRDPTHVVLTQSTARKYFGTEEAVGKMLKAPGRELMVEGVCEDVPKNSHLQFDILGNIRLIGLGQRPDYISFSVYTYISLHEDIDPDDIEAKLPSLVDKYAAGQIESKMGISYSDYIDAGNGYNYYLQPITSIHLQSHLEAEIKPGGNITYTYVLGIIALLILSIAGINFINLSTAKAGDRAKEVGLRKVIGGQKKQLIFQFLIESLAITVLSLVFAIILIELFLPTLNFLSGKELEINYFNNIFTIPLLLIICLVIGLLAGSYPAFVISSFHPILVIQGVFISPKGSSVLRNSLVIIQFFITISLIALTLTIIKQTRYLSQKDLGFKQENLIMVERANMLMDQTEAFKQELERNPAIELTSGSNTEISGGYYFGIMFQTDKLNSDVITSRAMVIDNDFFETMNLEIVDGRGFSEDFNDSLSIIINESAVNEFGLKNPIGTKLFNPGDGDQPTRQYTIIGIVKDFNYTSLHNNIKSFVMLHSSGAFPFIPFLNIRVKEGMDKEAVSIIRTTWDKFVPGEPVTLEFLSDHLSVLYNNEQRSGKIFGAFASIAILIAIIGVFGLATFMISKRTREIGVRKVFGASASSLFILVFSDLTRLILIAFVIAVPVTYLLIIRWLQNFAYKTEITIWIFITAGIIALLIAWLTISYQAIRAANTNPAEALRRE